MNDAPTESASPRADAIRRILVPVDFSDNTRKTVAYAKSFAAQLEASLHLLYVVPTTLVPLEAYELTPDYGTLVKWGEKNLNTLRSDLFGDDPAVSCEVKNGHPPHEIVDMARNHDFDMILMSTHGHGGIRHLLMGSTTEKVVRTSPVPVLTLHVQ